VRVQQHLLGLLLLPLLGASEAARAALQRYALQRTTVVLSRTGYGPTGEGIFALADGDLAQVVRLGDPEPGGNGSFQSFYPVVFGAAGHVAFGAILTGTSGGAGDDTALYRSDASGAVLIAREGQSVPAGAGSFALLSPLFVDAAGFVFFRSRLAGVGPGSDSGVFRGDGSSLVAIAREGEPAFGSAERIGELYSGAPKTVPAGTGAAALWFDLTGEGVSVGNESALIRSDGATQTRIAREGDALPGGGAIPDLSLNAPIGGDAAGNVAFFSDLGGGGTGIFRGSGGALEKIARSGDAVLGSSLAQIWNPARAAVNPAGQLVHSARLADGRDVLLLHTPPADVALVAVTGQPLPGGGVIDDNSTSDAFDRLSLDASGRVGFRVVATGLPLGPVEALLLWQAATLLELVREGAPAPAGGSFDDIAFHSPHFDSLGRVTFVATLSEGPPDANAGIFRADAGGVVELLREGIPAPNGDGFVELQDAIASSAGSALLFTAPIDASADSPAPSVDASRCQHASIPWVQRCGPHEGGTALVDDALPAPRLRALRVLADTTVTISIHPVLEIFLSERRIESAAPGQAGTGSSAAAIRWGVVTGWTLSGSLWCRSSPDVACTLAGALQSQTLDPIAASDFYDLGTWSFHGTGFTATPYLTARHESSNTQLRLRGRRAPNAAVPALPLVGLALIAGVLLAGARGAIRP